MPEDFEEDAIGRVIVGMMTSISDLDESTARQDVVRPTAVLDREHSVGIAPDDEDVPGAQSREAIDRLDALPLRADNPSHCRDKAREAALLLETLKLGQGSLTHSAMPEADPAQSGPGPVEGVDHAPADSSPKDQLRSRETRSPQAEVDVCAESPAGHEDERGYPLGELVRELQTDAAAVGVPDEMHPVDVKRVEQVADRGRVGAEAEITVAGVRGSVTDEVHSDDVTPGGSKGVPDLAPGVDARSHSVDKDHRDTHARGLGIGKPQAVQIHFTTLECHRNSPPSVNLR